MPADATANWRTVPAGALDDLADFDPETEALDDFLLRRTAWRCRVPGAGGRCCVLVAGPADSGPGLLPGTFLVIRTDAPPDDGATVLAALLDGNFLVRRLRRISGGVTLEPVIPGADALTLSGRAGRLHLRWMLPVAAVRFRLQG